MPASEGEFIFEDRSLVEFVPLEELLFDYGAPDSLYEEDVKPVFLDQDGNTFLHFQDPGSCVQSQQDEFFAAIDSEIVNLKMMAISGSSVGYSSSSVAICGDEQSCLSEDIFIVTPPRSRANSTVLVRSEPVVVQQDSNSLSQFQDEFSLSSLQVQKDQLAVVASGIANLVSASAENQCDPRLTNSEIPSSSCPASADLSEQLVHFNDGKIGKVPEDNQIIVIGDDETCNIELGNSSEDEEIGYKRERSVSTELMLKPAGTVRKKKQKDSEFSVGRPRGRSLSEIPEVQYGLQAFRRTVEDLNMKVSHIMEAGLSCFSRYIRKDITKLLHKELRSLLTVEGLQAEFVSAITTLLTEGSEDPLITADSEIVDKLSRLKMAHEVLLEDLNFNHWNSQRCLKATVTKYSFLCSKSAAESKIIMLQDLHAKYQASILSNFRQRALALNQALAQRQEAPSSTALNPGYMLPPLESSVVYPPTDLLERARQHRIQTEFKAGDSANNCKYKPCRRKELSGPRGTLPKAAADDMKSWLLDHFDNPRPCRSEKMAFARKWDISVKQVDDWFVNARARIVKPIAIQLWKELNPHKPGMANVYR